MHLTLIPSISPKRGPSLKVYPRCPDHLPPLAPKHLYDRLRLETNTTAVLVVPQGNNLRRQRPSLRGDGSPHGAISCWV